MVSHVLTGNEKGILLLQESDILMPCGLALLHLQVLSKDGRCPGFIIFAGAHSFGAPCIEIQHKSNVISWPDDGRKMQFSFTKKVLLIFGNSVWTFH